MSERVARWLWWWTLILIRRAPVRRFNHVIAARLGGERGNQFLERGKRQNAFARRHAVSIIRWALNVLSFCLLCLVLYDACQWLLAHGYFSAPGSPKRDALNDGG
jgi:hypothetical protein